MIGRKGPELRRDYDPEMRLVLFCVMALRRKGPELRRDYDKHYSEQQKRRGQSVGKDLN